eukprot:1510419-Rhodomonas_salina.2
MLLPGECRIRRYPPPFSLVARSAISGSDLAFLVPGANTPSTPGSAAGSVRGDTPSSEGQVRYLLRACYKMSGTGAGESRIVLWTAW